MRNPIELNVNVPHSPPGRTLVGLLRWVVLVGLLSVNPGCLSQRSQSKKIPGFGSMGLFSSSIWDGGWRRFREPVHEEAEPRLVRLQEHQPGKIPVVLVHGLLSDPSTWNPLVQGLRSDPAIERRFQFLAFVYPTGKSFIESAASLRRTLRQEARRLDPDGQDPALRNMILIGHSMGGLVCRLQVTSSETILWRIMSDHPLEEFDTDEETREKVREVLFFEPLSNVRRVVFIATPHAGSEWADRPLGRLARKIVHFPKALHEQYQQVVSTNRALLKSVTTGQIPTSVDRLSPDDPLLQAIGQLPFAEGVALHTILGTGYLSPKCERGDGIVSAASAHLPQADSEQKIEASHTEIHRKPATVEVVKRILLSHLRAGVEKELP